MNEELQFLRRQVEELEKRTRRLTLASMALGAAIAVTCLVGASPKKDKDTIQAQTVHAEMVDADFITTKTVYVTNGSSGRHVIISAGPAGDISIDFYDAAKQFPPRLSITLDEQGPRMTLIQTAPNSKRSIVSMWYANSLDFVNGRSSISMHTGDESNIAVSDPAGYQSILGTSVVESVNGSKSVTTAASLRFINKDGHVMGTLPMTP